MDSFELNKILGAILGTCLLLLVTSFTAGALFSPVMPEKPGFEIVAKGAPEGGAKEAAAPAVPIGKLLQTASVGKGTAAAKKCAASRTVQAGSAADGGEVTGAGPNELLLHPAGPSPGRFAVAAGAGTFRRSRAVHKRVS